MSNDRLIGRMDTAGPAEVLADVARWSAERQYRFHERVGLLMNDDWPLVSALREAWKLTEGQAAEASAQRGSERV